jgi:hypothetical protein
MVPAPCSSQGLRGRAATPEQVSVWVGLDVGKETHFDALISICPVLKRALGKRLGHAGVRDLVADYPT